MTIETQPMHVNQEGHQPHQGGYPSPKVDECRRLVANRYVEVGYVEPDDLDENLHLGSTLDPYVASSEYFWEDGKDGEVAATLRIIHPGRGTILSRLPIEKSFELYGPQRRILRRTRLQRPEHVVEISALAKEKGADSLQVVDMYKAVWQHAKRTGIELCAISADENLHKMLIASFGDAIVQAGDPAEMMGSVTVPSLLYPDRCADAMATIYRKKLENDGDIAAAEYRGLINYLKDGLEPEYFSDEEKAVLLSIGCTVD